MIESISSKSTKDDVALFFSKLCNFGDDIKNNLIKNDISGDILLDLKNSDYKNLGLKLGQIKKITNYLEENKEKFTQNEIKEVISKESSPEDVSKFFESFLNIKENINTLDGKKLLELNVDEIEELGLGLNYVKKKKLLKYIEYFKTLEMEPPESISEIVITKESKKEDVAKFLKIKLGFSEKSIEFLGLDGRGLFSLKENDIQKEEHLTQEEKEKILNFLIRNKKEYKDSDIKLTKESTNEEVTNFLKIKLGFSEQIIESLRLDGNSLFSLKEEEIKNKNNNLNQEEKDKLITFLKEIRKKEEEKKKSEIIINKESNVEDVKKFLKNVLNLSEKSIESMGLDGKDLLTLKENEIREEENLTPEEKNKLIKYLKSNNLINQGYQPKSKNIQNSQKDQINIKRDYSKKEVLEFLNEKFQISEENLKLLLDSDDKKKINKIGSKRFKELFKIEKNLRNEIDEYKSKKTFIYFEFEECPEGIFEKIKLVSINKETSIDKRTIFFEYINNKFPYKSEITEEIILIKEGIEKRFLITIKRYSNNYYKIFNNNIKEKTYSLEIVFYFQNSNDEIKYIEANNKKIYTKEILEKTKRYNLINIDLKTSIKIFNQYSNDKISEEENNINEAYYSPNLIYNFIYGNNKKIGKIYEIGKENELEELTPKEKLILKRINEIIDNKIDSFNIKKDFENLVKENIYYSLSDDDKKINNYLNDLNDKFNKMPFCLKFYESEPSNEDIEETRALCFLNIFLETTSEEWFRLIVKFQNDIEKILKENQYLNKKEIIMILTNYISAIKNDDNTGGFYEFKSFYNLDENSSYIKSELMYRDIISKLTIDSKLFFLYLQLNSGSGIDYITCNHFYRIKHISLIEIKAHLLNDFFYPFFFTYFSSKEIFAWNSKRTQIKNYNQNFLVNYEDLDSKFYYNDSEKLLLLKFHEYGHTKFINSFSLHVTPRYLLKDNLEIIDNKKKMEKIIRVNDIEINQYIGESGCAIELYLFDDPQIVNKILKSKGVNLENLFKMELYIQKDFKELNQIVNSIKFKDEEEGTNKSDNKQKKEGVTSIPKLNIKNGAKIRIYKYSEIKGFDSIEFQS